MANINDLPIRALKQRLASNAECMVDPDKLHGTESRSDVVSDRTGTAKDADWPARIASLAEDAFAYCKGSSFMSESELGNFPRFEEPRAWTVGVCLKLMIVIENTKYFMLYTLILILLLTWLLGLFSSYTFGGLIHALLVVALVLVVIRAFQGRRV